MEDKWFATLDYLVPIRLKGDRFPAAIAQVKRSNWEDITIFYSAVGTAEKVFSFSCRNDDAIEWIASKGSLSGMNVFEQFGPDPQGMKTPTGHRWLQRTAYKWDQSNERFDVISKKWILFKSPIVFPNRKEKLPDKIDFAWKH